MEEFCDFELMTSIMQQNCQIIDIKTVKQEPQDKVQLFEWYKMVELFLLDSQGRNRQMFG